MSRIVSSLATLALTAALVAPFAVGVPSRADGQPSKQLRLTCELARSSVKLGEDIEVKVTVANPSASTHVLPSIRLADDSVSIEVAGNGPKAMVTRRFGEFRVVDGKVAFERHASSPQKLAPGKKLTGSVRFAAVRAGELRLLPRFGLAGDEQLRCDPLDVKVAPRGPGAKRLSARIETERGAVRVQLDSQNAFNSVSHFWTLAREGFFDGLTVHRVVEDVLAQSGDPRGDGLGGPGWYLPAESHTAEIERGDLVLARGVHPHSAGSQWFLVAAKSTSAFNRGFTRLGKADEGLDVIDGLAGVELRPESDRPVEPDRVTSVKVGGR